MSFKKDNSLFMEQEERVQLQKEMNEFQFKETRFSFINDHFGLRKENLHILLGTQGQGKSTLSRSIIEDLASKHKILLYSSEETRTTIKAMMSLRDTRDNVLKNISILNEDDIISAYNTPITQNEFFRVLETQIIENDAEILIIDNITTSEMYDQRTPLEQQRFVNCLRRVITRRKIPCLLVAHTKAGVKDDQQALIAADDIRGTKTLPNKAEFVYIYQKLIQKTEGSSIPAIGIVRVLKARGVGNIGNIYSLVYNFEMKSYLSDKQLNQSQFKEFYSNRFKL